MSTVNKPAPKVFISYSWDDESHMSWVLNLSNRLVSDGVNVILDRYDMRAGKNLHAFIDHAVTTSDRVIIIFTPSYKQKAEDRLKLAGTEYSLINAGIYNNIASQEKVIPVLRSGSREESIPLFIQQYINLDFSDDALFEKMYEQLLRVIYNKPEVTRPSVGKEPHLPPVNSTITGTNTVLGIEKKRNDITHVQETSVAKTGREKRKKFRMINSVTVVLGLILLIAFSQYTSDVGEQSLPDTVISSIMHDTLTDLGDSLTETKVADVQEKVADVKPDYKKERHAIKPRKLENTIKYDMVYPAIEGRKRVVLNGMYGFTDVDGNALGASDRVELIYDYAEDFSEGMAKVMRSAKYGYINRNGNLAIGFLYDNAESFVAGKARVRKNGKWFYINAENVCVEGCDE